jgi:hypothetical protein
MFFERAVGIANTSNADHDQEHKSATQTHIDINNVAHHAAEGTVLGNHADVHFHDTAGHGLNDEKVAQHCVDGGKQKAEKNLLSEGQTLPKVVHVEISFEEPGRDVESQAARKPFPEPAVNARSNMLVRSMGLVPSLECKDLRFQGLHT